MRRPLLIVPSLGLAALLILAVASGADMGLAAWAAGWAARVPDRACVRAARLACRRAGRAAVTARHLLCLRVFHSVGPGTARLLIGGYRLVRDVPVLRLSLILVLSALGQAVTEIVLVGPGLFVLGWTRKQLIDTAETVMLAGHRTD